MAKLMCPNCGADVASHDGWAKAALSTLIPAPAVYGMATQVRCPACQHLFSQAEGGKPGGWRALVPAAVLIAVLLVVAFLLP